MHCSIRNYILLMFVCCVALSTPARAATINLGNWTGETVSPPYSAPHFGVDRGSLVVTALDNTNTFGYWKSPDNILNTEAGYIYRLIWTLSGDSTPLDWSPSFRMRMNSSNLQLADMLGGESMGDGSWMPPSTGRIFGQYVIPAASDTLADLSLDMYNFSTFDLESASLALDLLEVDKLSLSTFPETLVKAWYFDSDVDGWTFETIPWAFTEPVGAWDNGELRITAMDNTNNFGFWSSPGNGFLIHPGSLYKVNFTLRSDTTDPEQVPDIRLRLNTSDWQAYSTRVITSVHGGNESPGINQRLFPIYLHMPRFATDEDIYLICSCELLNFDPGNSPTGSIFLDRVTIYRLTLP